MPKPPPAVAGGLCLALFVIGSVASVDTDDGVVDDSGTYTVTVASAASVGATFTFSSDDQTVREAELTVTLSVRCAARDTPPAALPAITFVTQALPATDGVHQDRLEFGDPDGRAALTLDPQVPVDLSAEALDERTVSLRCTADAPCAHVYRAEVAREIDELATEVECTVSGKYLGQVTPRDATWTLSIAPSGTE